MLEDIEIARNQLTDTGFFDIEVNPETDLFAEIEKLKKEKNAVVLAHYYQEPDIQDVADYIGDSLGLSQQAAKTNAQMIVFAGVHFMAETAKILSPHKKVVLPDLKAGCSLADSCPPELFARFKAKYPDHVVIMYVNCSADIKAMSDIVCTSSNAQKVIESVSPEKKIIFGPDKNLGKYLIQKTGRDMVLWEGACIVHEIFSAQKILKLKNRHPNALVIAHPECETPVLELADYIGSTTGLLKFTVNNPSMEFIVATEAGILHQMQKASPNKTFIPAPPDNSCACNDCPYMKRNTLEKLYLCMKYELPEVTVPEDISVKAKKSIDRMLEISAAAGL